MVKDFIKEYKGPTLPVGTRVIKKDQYLSSALIDYNSFLASRHSVRQIEIKTTA